MPLRIEITIDNKKVEKILLKASKTIDGNIIISDHPEVDILILTTKNKVVALPKEELDDEVFDTQKRLFDFLVRKGVIDYSSVQAGNFFMSTEGVIPTPKNEGDKIQYCLYVLSKFIDDEIPYYENMEQYKKHMEQNLLDPEIDEYTEFDPTRQAAVKGTLPPRMVKYGIHSIYRL